MNDIAFPMDVYMERPWERLKPTAPFRLLCHRRKHASPVFWHLCVYDANNRIVCEMRLEGWRSRPDVKHKGKVLVQLCEVKYGY
jgi:hypothetical protein